jgi:hypothetical protein
MGLMGAKYLKDKNKKATPMIGAAAELMKKKKELLGKKMGGVMKYKRGSGLDLPVISSVKPAVHKTKRAQNLSKMKIQFNKQRSRMGDFAKKKGLPKPLNPNMAKGFFKTVGVFPKVSGPFSSMAEMRKAKGFKPGESATDFNKRRMALEVGKKALKATTVGKIALGVGAAGVAAQQYLKSKMKKKDETKKKMAGGMAKKYSEGMTLADMKPYGGSYIKKKAEMKASQTENVKKLTTSDDAYSPEKMFVVTQGTKKGNRSRPTRVRETDDWNAKKIVDRENSKGINTRSFATYKLAPALGRDYERRQSILQNMANKSRSYSGPTKKMPTPTRRSKLKPAMKMGGGMMNKPMGYKLGTMVKARGCKLGRTRPTKIT